VTTRYWFCKRGQRDWTSDQWQDECTAKGWARASAVYTVGNRGSHDFTGSPNPNTTEFCVRHNTNPGRYGLYFNGMGWAYSQAVCHQDRDGNGSYETRVVGVPNCNQQGYSPGYKPKWVDPRWRDKEY